MQDDDDKPEILENQISMIGNSPQEFQISLVEHRESENKGPKPDKPGDSAHVSNKRPSLPAEKLTPGQILQSSVTAEDSKMKPTRPIPILPRIKQKSQILTPRLASLDKSHIGPYQINNTNKIEHEMIKLVGGIPLKETKELTKITMEDDATALIFDHIWHE